MSTHSEKRKSKSNSRSNHEISRLEQSKFGMYRGPLRINRGTSGLTKLMQLTSSTTTASSAIGVLAAEITFNPNTCTEWASYAARFREYRVMGVELEFKPYGIVNLSTYAGAPVVVAVNKGGVVGIPTSFNAVLAMAKSQVNHVLKPWKVSIRADDYTDLDVGSTTTPSSEFSLLYYADGLSNSTTYGRLVMYWVVQFSSPQ